MLEAFMQLTTARQEILSQNVANANTPGFLGQEIPIPKNFSDFVKSSSSSNGISLTVTNSKHLTGSKPKIKFKSYIDPDAGSLKPNGNNVDLATQAKKTSQNAVLYETALKAYNGTSSLIETAVSKGR